MKKEHASVQFFAFVKIIGSRKKKRRLERRERGWRGNGKAGKGEKLTIDSTARKIAREPKSLLDEPREIARSRRKNSLNNDITIFPSCM